MRYIVYTTRRPNYNANVSAIIVAPRCIAVFHRRIARQRDKRGRGQRVGDQRGAPTLSRLGFPEVHGALKSQRVAEKRTTKGDEALRLKSARARARGNVTRRSRDRPKIAGNDSAISALKEVGEGKGRRVGLDRGQRRRRRRRREVDGGKNNGRYNEEKRRNNTRKTPRRKSGFPPGTK